jgi:hypothetical protein
MSLAVSRVGNSKKPRKRADQEGREDDAEKDPMSTGVSLAAKRVKVTTGGPVSGSASRFAATSARALDPSIVPAPFRVPLTKEEKGRRKERKVCRFFSRTSPAKGLD